MDTSNTNNIDSNMTNHQIDSNLQGNNNNQQTNQSQESNSNLMNQQIKEDIIEGNFG